MLCVAVEKLYRKTFEWGMERALAETEFQLTLKKEERINSVFLKIGVNPRRIN